MRTRCHGIIELYGPYHSSLSSLNSHCTCVRPISIEHEFPDIKARRFEIRRHFPEVPVRKEGINRLGG